MIVCTHPSYGRHVMPYIGCCPSGQSIESRFKQHCKGSGGAKYLCSAIKKHGKEWFQIQQIDVGNTPEQAYELEKWWIARLKTKAPNGGYNLDDGGKGPARRYGWTEESRLKMSAAKKGIPSPKKGKPSGYPSWSKGKKLSVTHRANLSISHKGVLAGENHPMFGKTHTEEAKRKIRENRIPQVGENHPMFGKQHSEASLTKMREAQQARVAAPDYVHPMKGKHFSLEGGAGKGRVSPMKGRTHTPEWAAHMSAVMTGKTMPPRSQEYRDNMRAVKLGTRASEDTKRKMSIIQTGRKHTLESRERMSLAQKGRKATAETRARLSESHKGKTLSAESRARLSASIKAMWEKRKNNV